MSATEKKIKARKADAFSPSPSRKKDAFNLGSGIYSKEAVEASRRDRQFRLEQRRNESHQREMEFRAISSRRSFLFKLLNALILVFALVSMIVLGIGISQTWFTADSLIPTILFILLSVNVLHSILGICAASKFNQGLLSCFLFICCISMLGEVMLISIIALKYQNMSDFLDSIWSELGEASLNSIQENFNCCGFSSPSDRSQQPCPSGVTTGCKNPLLNATRDFILYFLIATVFIFLLQGILLWRGIKLKRRMQTSRFELDTELASGK